MVGFKEIKFKGKVSIKIILEFKINIVNIYKIFGYEVILNLGFGVGVEVGIGLMEFYGIDNKGFYIKKEVEFEGIKFLFFVIGIV